MGLSPRVRGNLAYRVERGRAVRTIPACTGEPDRRAAPSTVARDYPRVYGGTSDPSTISTLVMGLSPRVRGNPREGQRCPRSARTIPACTGEPLPTSRGLPTPWDYPRVYGGTPHLSYVVHCSKGLSPRVRGNRFLPLVECPRVRTIPACTGERSMHDERNP